MTQQESANCPWDFDELSEFVLGHLPLARCAEVETHLASCVRCEEEIRSLRESWACLALATPPQSPSEDILERVKNRIQGISDPLITSTRLAPFAVPDAGPHSGAMQAKGRSVRTILSYVTAAIVLLVLVPYYRPFAGTNAVAPGDPATQLPIAHDSTQLEADLQQMLRLQKEFGSPNVRLLEQEPGGGAPAAARAPVIWDVDAREWHFFAIHFDPPPSGQTYVLWWIDTAGQAIQAARLEIDANGNGKKIVALPAHMDQIKRAIITREPDEVPQAPGSDMYMAFDWSN